MRLYKRGKVWWVFWSRDDRESTGQATRPAADAWARRRELERADPAHAAAKAATVGRLIAAYLADRKAAGKAAATLAFYQQKMGHVARLFGIDCPLAEITAKGLDEYAHKRRAERAKDPTIAKELKALSAALRKAKRWGWFPGDLDAIVPQDLGAPSVPRRRWLTPVELDLVLEEIEGTCGPEAAAALAFAVAAGARASEVGRATRGDIERALSSGFVQLRGTKTAKSAGVVPVISIFRPLLERALAGAVQGGPEALAFTRWVRVGGNSLRALAAACVRLGIPAVTWNDLRRTQGRWLRQAGVSVELIAEQLRHTSPAMARRVYAQIEVGEVAEQIEALLCARAVRTDRATSGDNER
jgi:integrase